MSKGRGMTLIPGAGMLTVTWLLQGPGCSKSQGWGQCQAVWAWALSVRCLWDAFFHFCLPVPSGLGLPCPCVACLGLGGGNLRSPPPYHVHVSLEPPSERLVTNSQRAMPPGEFKGTLFLVALSHRAVCPAA